MLTVRGCPRHARRPRRARRCRPRRRCRRDVVAVLGPSGSGKSTLLRAVAGLQRLDEGSVSLDGRPLDGVPPHRRGIGLMFQDDALFPHRDVAANVGFGLRMQGVGAASRRAPGRRAARSRRARGPRAAVRSLAVGGRAEAGRAGARACAGAAGAAARRAARRPRPAAARSPRGRAGRALRRDRADRAVRHA